LTLRGDAGFFANTHVHTSALVNLGKGDPGSLFPRLPRLPFDKVVRIE